MLPEQKSVDARERVLRGSSKRVVVVLPAYNASSTLKATIDEIPVGYADDLIVVDDASRDSTSEKAEELGLRVIRHPENRGYGGNQKTCYESALELGADIIVMLHPDNQYNPQVIPNLILPLILEQADVSLASRFICDPLKGGPVAGGMPLYKYFLNKILTTLQNWLMGTFFSEFHTGYRAFTADALRAVNLEALSDDFAFDNQILCVFAWQKKRIAQIAVETRYFKEASSISILPGMRYAAMCLWNGWRYFLHRGGVCRWRWLDTAMKESVQK